MTEITLQALYRNGALQFDEQLDLPDNTPVEVQIRALVKHDPQTLAFEKEVNAFNRLKPQLLEKYAGKVVAIYQGQVIAVGSDKETVFNEVYSRYGEIICYLEWVEPETPRRIRMPSVHVVRR